MKIGTKDQQRNQETIQGSGYQRDKGKAVRKKMTRYIFVSIENEF